MRATTRGRLDFWIRSRVFTATVYRHPWLVDRLNRLIYWLVWGIWG